MPLLFEKMMNRTPKFMEWDKYKYFSVVAPFLTESASFLFEIRSNKLRTQPGEICFPGGSICPGETPETAGVRELTEELLVLQRDVELIAPLDILLRPYSAMIYPYIGHLHNYQGTFSKDEVKEIFTVPFEHFLQNDPAVYYNEISVKPSHDFPYSLIGREDYPWRTGRYPVLFYRYQNKVIWGITAQIIHNIVELHREGK